MALLTAEDYLRFPRLEADRRYAYGEHPQQFGELTLPEGEPPHPTIVLIHGGGYREMYDLGPLSALAADLAEAGFAVWNIEYRRQGNGGAFPWMFRDVGRAADYLRGIGAAHQLDLGRVFSMGHSAGGHLALWLAGRRNIDRRSPLYVEEPLSIRAAIALAPLAHIRRAVADGLSSDALLEVMGGLPEDAPAHYRAGSPSELLPTGVAQLIIVGSEDRGMLENARAYQKAAVAAGDQADLIVLPGAGHFEIVSVQTEAWRELRRALVELRRSGRFNCAAD